MRPAVQKLSHKRKPFTKAATSLRYSYGGPPEPWRRRKLTRLAKDALGNVVVERES